MTQVLGIDVTETEAARFEQVFTEQLRTCRSVDEARMWAAASIGITAQMRLVLKDRNEYARLINA